jgi:septal ring factor EnvC (AmiA/AmiB activator)
MRARTDRLYAEKEAAWTQYLSAQERLKVIERLSDLKRTELAQLAPRVQQLEREREDLSRERLRLAERLDDLRRNAERSLREYNEARAQELRGAEVDRARRGY